MILILDGPPLRKPASEPHRQFDGDGMLTICGHGIALREGWPYLPDLTVDKLIDRVRVWRPGRLITAALPNHCTDCREER